jgi:hypothetical protein
MYEFPFISECTIAIAGLWAGRLGFYGSIPGGAGNFSLYYCIQNGSGTHPAFYPMGTRGSFSGGKAAGA